MSDYPRQAQLANLSIRAARIACEVVREMEIEASVASDTVALAGMLAVASVVPAAMTAAALVLSTLSSAPALLGCALLAPLALAFAGPKRRCYGVQA